MAELWIRLPDRAPVKLGRERAALTIGRDPGNDLVLEDSSLSRNHARLTWREGTAMLEDLGSRNGTLVNGDRLLEPRRVKGGDEIVFGRLSIRLEEGPDAPQDPDSSVSFLMEVDRLRSSSPGTRDTASAQRWKEALDLVHALSLDMLGDVTTEMMLWDLLERLFTFLKPGRGAVLLRDAKGAMAQVAARSRSRGQDFQVELSRTMLEAAVERREALLINNPLLDSRLAQAQSIVTSGVTSIMTVPLEHGGEVVGIIYMDAGPMRGAFTEEDLRLVAVVSHMAAAKIRTTRLLEELVVKRTMEKELEVARRIQERLLPDRCPALEGFELFGINVACWNVSGDLYGFWPGPGGRTWLAIADVSGKGIGPGLLMATFQALMQAWTEGAESPAILAAKISLALSKRTTTNRFITAFLALLDPAARTLTFTNAGHNPIPLLKADGTVEELPSQGFPLAMFPGREYGQGTVRLGPGDLLFLYTDGITEAADPEGVEFDLARVCRTLRDLGPLPLPDLNAGLVAALQEHTRGAPATDDRTIVMVRCVQEGTWTS
ncbi:SpoIIE family protein phosphatase [Mesoterricola silvestris]|uniref:FHA domain-containing protein n=1 Tax=Mesoterricola silvestris TaxID=2927979 RepID=A0AA48GQ62_9BACT|nr:SpoIIE family protein phosphatase [Mesoterricola silvestris]BDU71972.1 hypothetical protein METEAL_11460 [Mesoterricola silvestris]